VQAVTITKMQGAKYRSCEVNPQPLAWQTWTLHIFTRSTPFQWQTDRFSRTALCMAVRYL